MSSNNDDNGENDDGYDDGVRNKAEASSSGDRRARFYSFLML